jgi:hypothetical protein
MVVLKKWRESPAALMRQDFDAALAQAPGPMTPARCAFLTTIKQTHATLLALYLTASPIERRAILRYIKKASASMRLQGAWPTALGWEIASLNVASRFEPGGDAAYVKAGTDIMVEEAMRTQSPRPDDGPAAAEPQFEAVALKSLSSLAPRRGRSGRYRLRQLAIEARQTKQAAFAEIADQTFRLTQGARSARQELAAVSSRTPIANRG